MQRSFVSKNISVNNVKEEIIFFSNLEQIWEPVAKEHADVMRTVYLGSKSGLMLSYDRWSNMAVVSDDGEVIYNFKKTPWYTLGNT